MIRDLTDPALAKRAAALLSEVWHSPGPEDQMPAELLQVLAWTGGYARAAFDGDRMIGVSAALRTGGDPAVAHSHITGIVPDARDRGVGRALKLDQREWALGVGIRTLTWTFDPLQRRNAVFNLRSLGVRVRDFKPDFYGQMRDGLNAGAGSDRLYVGWDLTSAPTPAPTAVRLIDTPEDIGALRVADPAAAEHWKLTVREAFQSALRDGLVVAGITSGGSYVLTESEG